MFILDDSEWVFMTSCLNNVNIENDNNSLYGYQCYLLVACTTEIHCIQNCHRDQIWTKYFTMAAAESGNKSDGSWDDYPAENPVKAAVLNREIAAVAGMAWEWWLVYVWKLLASTLCGINWWYLLPWTHGNHSSAWATCTVWSRWRIHVHMYASFIFPLLLVWDALGPHCTPVNCSRWTNHLWSSPPGLLAWHLLLVHNHPPHNDLYEI